MTNKETKDVISSWEELVPILIKAQITYHRKMSFTYGSQYLTIDQQYYRVSDHTNVNNNYTLGVNDFRSFNDLYLHLKQHLDLSDKSALEKEYKSEAKKLLKVETNGYRTPNGGLFGCLDSALNHMWLSGVEIPLKNKILERNITLKRLNIELTNACADGDRATIERLKKSIMKF